MVFSPSLLLITRVLPFASSFFPKPMMSVEPLPPYFPPCFIGFSLELSPLPFQEKLNLFPSASLWLSLPQGFFTRFLRKIFPPLPSASPRWVSLQHPPCTAANPPPLSPSSRRSLKPKMPLLGFSLCSLHLFSPFPLYVEKHILSPPNTPLMYAWNAFC